MGSKILRQTARGTVESFSDRYRDRLWSMLREIKNRENAQASSVFGATIKGFHGGKKSWSCQYRSEKDGHSHTVCKTFLVDFSLASSHIFFIRTSHKYRLHKLL